MIAHRGAARPIRGGITGRVDMIRAEAPKHPDMVFLVERIKEESYALLDAKGHVPLDMIVRIQATLDARLSIVGDYLLACQQSYGDRKTRWGSTARSGLYSACHTFLRQYVYHPEFKEEWL